MGVDGNNEDETNKDYNDNDDDMLADEEYEEKEEEEAGTEMEDEEEENGEEDDNDGDDENKEEAISKSPPMFAFGNKEKMKQLEQKIISGSTGGPKGELSKMIRGDKFSYMLVSLGDIEEIFWLPESTAKKFPNWALNSSTLTLLKGK